MANIDRIVRVQIALRTASITGQAFSDLMLYGQFQSTNLVEIITDPDELLEDYGVQPGDPIYRAASAVFSQIPRINRLFIGRDTTGGTSGDVAANLAAIAAESNEWYGSCDTAHDEARAVAMAEWTEAHEKLFLTVLSQANNASLPAATDTTSTAALLKNGQFFRTAWWYHPDPLQFPDAALAARMFTRYPGQETWANQRLNAVTPTRLSETLYNNITNKNGNTFEPFRNIAITQNGKVAGGEWIDVIRFRDWLCEEIKVRLFSQLVDNRNPYTDPGIATFRSRLIEALDFGVRRGGIAPPELDEEGNLIPSYTTSVPLSATISPNQKASRVLQDIYFTARIAGAIHAVEIQGTLTYETLPVAEAA